MAFTRNDDMDAVPDCSQGAGHVDDVDACAADDIAPMEHEHDARIVFEVVGFGGAHRVAQWRVSLWDEAEASDAIQNIMTQPTGQQVPRLVRTSPECVSAWSTDEGR